MLVLLIESPLFVIVQECDVITISRPEYKVEIKEIIQDCEVIQTNKCSVASVLKEYSRNSINSRCYRLMDIYYKYDK